jgi:hypothetical protein
VQVAELIDIHCSMIARRGEKINLYQLHQAEVLRN